MEINLLYLATIAFMPFPTALVGQYGGQEIAVVLYAVTLAAASTLETCLLWRAHLKGFMRVRFTADGFRWAMLASLAPVVVFLVSIPVAFAVSPEWALYTWVLIFPIEMLVDRLKPEHADRDAASASDATADQSLSAASRAVTTSAGMPVASHSSGWWCAAAQRAAASEPWARRMRSAPSSAWRR